MALSDATFPLTTREHLKPEVHMRLSMISLPLEVLRMIADCFNYTRDLSRLSRTCKGWRAAALPVLYKCVGLKVPHQANEYRALERLLSSPGEGLQYTVSLKIQTVHSFKKAYHEHDGSSTLSRPTPMSFSDTAWSDTLNALIRSLLMKMPRNTLEIFIWSHNCAVSRATIQLLMRFHRDSLSNLQVGPLSHYAKYIGISSRRFQTLCIRSFTKLKTENKYDLSDPCTLRRLDLGVEIPLVKAYMVDEIYDDTDPQNQLATQLRAEMESQLEETEGIEYFPNVDQISLRGLDCASFFIGRYQDRMFNFRALKSLTLESSCYNFETAVTNLGTLELLCLQILHIRQEGVHAGSLPSLVTFLRALPSLTALFVLLEGNINGRDLDLGEVLQKHGRTLQKLILDLRRGNRRTIRDDPTIWPPQIIKDIIVNCPNLMELGIPLQWTFRENLVNCIKIYFPKLRTLNIRNLPSMNDIVAFMTLDEFVKGLATSFVEMSINAPTRDPHRENKTISAAGIPSSLTTISLGALKYRDVWDGTDVDRGSAADDYLMLRTYSIGYRRNAAGQCAPLLTLLAKGPTSHIKAICSDISILEPYWLG